MSLEENLIRKFLDKANEHLNAAEELAEKKGAAHAHADVNHHCREAVVALFRAFLRFRGEDSGKDEGIDILFSRCAALVDEFYSLEDLLAYLTVEDPIISDEDDINEKIDATNEVWDFVQSFLPEKYYQ